MDCASAPEADKPKDVDGGSSNIGFPGVVLLLNGSDAHAVGEADSK